MKKGPVLKAQKLLLEFFYSFSFSGVFNHWFQILTKLVSKLRIKKTLPYVPSENQIRNKDTRFPLDFFEKLHALYFFSDTLFINQFFFILVESALHETLI